MTAIARDTHDEGLYKGKRWGQWRRDVFELEERFLTVCVCICACVSKLFQDLMKASCLISQKHAHNLLTSMILQTTSKSMNSRVRTPEL